MSSPRPRASIVLPVHNEGALLAECLEAILQSTTVPIEIIVVDDASTDGCCDFLRAAGHGFAGVKLVSQEHKGAAETRNAGARLATAEHIVFMDGHCFPAREWLEDLLETAARNPQALLTPCISSYQEPHLKGYGATIKSRNLSFDWLARQGDEPYEVPIAGAGCMLLSTELFRDLGGFDAMRVWGVEDVELSLRCWLFGYPIMVVPRADVRHFFKPGLRKLSQMRGRGENFMYNALRTAVLHFDGERLSRLLAHFQGSLGYSRVAASMLESDIFERYCFVRSRRKHDGDWYCRKFGVDL